MRVRRIRENTQFRSPQAGRLEDVLLHPKGPRVMAPADMLSDEAPRASRLIAEALVKRHSPSRIAMKARRMGLSPQLTRTMVVACSAAAIEPHDRRVIRPS